MLEQKYLEGKYTPFGGMAELSPPDSEGPTMALPKASSLTGMKWNLILCVLMCYKLHACAC